MVLAQKQKCRSMDYIIEKMQCFQQPCRKTRTRHRERLAEREIISRMYEKAAGKQDILCPLKLHRIYIMHVHVCVCSFKWCCATWSDTKEHLPETRGSVIQESLGSCQSGESERLPKQQHCSQSLKVTPSCWWQHVVQTQRLEESSWIWPRNFFLKEQLSVLEGTGQSASGENDQNPTQVYHLHTSTMARKAVYPKRCKSGCGGLSENWPHRLIYLNVWSLLAELFGEGLRGVALMEEVCHWGWTVRFQKHTPGLVSQSTHSQPHPPHAYGSNLSSQLLLQWELRHAPHHKGPGLTLWNYNKSPVKWFLLQVALVMTMSFHSNSKVTKAP